MKILHVGPLKGDCSATGVTQSIRGLAPAQAAIGLKVGLLPSLPLQGQTMEELPGVCLLAGPRQRQVNAWLISQDWITRIREEFGRPDLVNFHSTYIPFQVALARQCRRVGWPYIVTAHGGMIHLAQGIRRTKKRIANLLFFRSYVKRAAAMHALSPKEAEGIRDAFEVKRIIIVPNGVDDYLIEAFNKLTPADLGTFKKGNDLILGFIGRIDVYHKGLDLLLEGMAKLKSENGLDKCKLLLVGPFHTPRDKRLFWKDVESLGLKHNIKTVGPKYGDEKLSYFLACDVFVHTSRFEGMPMSVLEAMALGRPCLVTPESNMADVTRECGGWVCAPDSHSITQTLLDIYRSRQLLPKIGKRGREVVNSRFTWRKVAKRLAEEYSKIINLSNV